MSWITAAEWYVAIAIPVIALVILVIIFFKIRGIIVSEDEAGFIKFLETCNSSNMDDIDKYLKERKKEELFRYWRTLYQRDYTSLFTALAVSFAMLSVTISLIGMLSTGIASTKKSSATASTQEIEIWTVICCAVVVVVFLAFELYIVVKLIASPVEMELRMANIRVAKEVLNIYIEKGSVSELFNKSEIRGKEGFHLSFENTPNRTYEINIKDSLVCPEGDSKEKAAENKVDFKNEHKKDTKTKDP